MRKILLLTIILCIMSFGIVGCGNQIDSDTVNNSNNEIYNIKFNNVENKSMVNIIDKNLIENILIEESFNDYYIIIFNKIDESTNLYAGLVNEDEYYNLGVVADKAYIDTIQITNVDIASDKSILKITGSLGANYGKSNYYNLDNKPQMLLTVDGHSKEIDLNNDGILEIISSYGTPTLTNIYMWNNNSFDVVNLNELLDATSVIHLDNNIFEAYKQDTLDKFIVEYLETNELQLK